MKISRKSEYALLAMLELASRSEQCPVSSMEIASRQEIPKQFLDQLLLQLKRAGMVRATRGASGGYRLARPPQEISLAEIIRLLDGALAPVESVSQYFYEHTPVERHDKLLLVFRDIRDLVSDRLEKTTLADLL